MECSVLIEVSRALAIAMIASEADESTDERLVNLHVLLTEVRRL